MKKIVFTLLGFSSLMIISCRQQEEMMDSEDLKSLSVLQEAKNKVNALKQNNIKSVDSTIVIKKLDASISSFQALEEMDLDKMQPPR